MDVEFGIVQSRVKGIIEAGNCARDATVDWVICISYKAMEFNCIGCLIRRVADSTSGYTGYVVMVEIYTQYSSFRHSVDDLYAESGTWYISLWSDAQVLVVSGVARVWKGLLVTL